MSKKVIQVNGECTRQMEQNGYGSFYSTHNQKDIEEYLRHMDADSSIEEFESIFSDDWEDVDAYCVDNFDVSFEETDRHMTCHPNRTNRLKDNRPSARNLA